MPLRDHRMYQIMALNYVFAIQVCHSVKFLTRCTRRSAFFLFCAEFRPKVKSENPGLTIGDTAKKLGEMWNSKTAEDKQPYEKKAAKLKEKYDKVMTHFPNASSLYKNTNICFPQDIVAYRTKGKVDSESAATADDDDEEEDEEEGEEEEDDDEEDDE